MNVIELSNISKSFTIKEQPHLSGFSEKSFKNDIQVLKNINLKIKKGTTTGIYGPNGSGKSTLFRIIAKIIKPDSGTIITKGKVASVIELGTGLHPELSGFENISLYGFSLGMSKDEIRTQTKKIINFSEISSTYIYQPIKKYSSGMVARLAFSIAAHSNPTILLIDEVLSVGDYDFRSKVHKKIEELKKSTSILITSHSLHLLMGLCNQIITIDNGVLLNQELNTKNKSKIKNIIESGNDFKITVISNSMKPVMSKGEKINITKKAYSKLNAGDIIAFTFPNLDIYFTHRIIAKTKTRNKTGLLTKGDANPYMDTWIVQRENYLGLVNNG
ncbi:signal peptidase I [Patescibacteria group bacterium]